MHHTITESGSKQTVTILWDSVTEPTKAAQQIADEFRRTTAVEYATGKRGGSESRDKAKRERWLGAPDFATLKSRLETGWPEGVERLMRLAVREIEATSIRRRRVRGDQGDEIDMQAVYRGDLSRAWTRTRRQNRTGTRQVNIVCNLGASASTDSAELFWRGASALRVAAALTEAGYTVGIYAGECGRDSDESGSVTVAQFVEIKAPDSPLDMSALAAITCMPGFFRTSLFGGIVVGCDMVGKNACYSLGRADHNLAPYAESIGLTGCIYQPQIDDEQSAGHWIEAALSQVQNESLPLAA